MVKLINGKGAAWPSGLRALSLEPGDPGLKSFTLLLNLLYLYCLKLISFLYSQVVCLLPGRILQTICLFTIFVPICFFLVKPDKIKCIIIIVNIFIIIIIIIIIVIIVIIIKTPHVINTNQKCMSFTNIGGYWLCKSFFVILKTARPISSCLH